MKKRIQLIFLAVAASLGLSNCMDVQQIVKVKKDGSGTIEETMILSLPPELAAMAGDQDPLGDLLKGDAQKDRAKEMGEGVELVSSEKFDKDGKKGLKTIFKFADINKLKLNGDAGMSAMNPDPNAKKKKDDDKVIKFKFEKGDTSKLTIVTPPMEGVDGADEKIDPQQFAMMSQFMKGMRIRVSVEPEGKITKTDASYSDADSVTLVDIELDKLLEDQGKFEEFTALSKEKDREKVAAKMKELGIKGEAKEEITVEFK